nr:RNA-directed DNA polymerase, eukaryota [Tanacetum cinerariifolium]
MNAFSGIPLDNSLTISHLFYADDAIFVGKWDASNLKIILKVLQCFHMASGLKININKSKLMRYDVHSDEVEIASRYIGYSTFVAPFSHLGVKEEVTVKLIDFLQSPHATTKVMLAEREHKVKKRKSQGKKAQSPIIYGLCSTHL